MATPLGTGVVTSISRRYIVPEIIDAFYDSNPVFFRINQKNKKVLSGGTHIENPFHYKGFTNGGSYSGFDTYDVAPNDTIKNGAWDWKQYQVPVSVDDLTLIQTDSPEAIANFMQQYFAIAGMEMNERLATGLWSDGTDVNDIDGLDLAVATGGTYAGLSRTTNTWLNAQIDSTTSDVTEVGLQAMHSNVGVGGRQATLIVSRQDQYNRYLELLRADKRYVADAAGQDTALADAGFSNILFNGTPWVVDSHVPDGGQGGNTDSAIFFLNEDYIDLCVVRDRDFYMEDFQKPINQNAFTASLQWAGNLRVTNPARQGKMTDVDGT